MLAIDGNPATRWHATTLTPNQLPYLQPLKSE